MNLTSICAWRPGRGLLQALRGLCAALAALVGGQPAHAEAAPDPALLLWLAHGVFLSQNTPTVNNPRQFYI